jgi:hypothetical protein
MRLNRKLIIEQLLGSSLVAGKTYPRPLPEELQQWYCYTIDGGHSVLCALSSAYAPGADPASFLVPAPVKSVLRAGYSQQDGYIVVDLPYDSQIGLRTAVEDEEY